MLFFVLAGATALQRRRSNLLGEQGSSDLLAALLPVLRQYGVEPSSLLLTFTVDSSNAVFRHLLLGTPSDSACPISDLPRTVRQLRCMGTADSQVLSRNSLVSVSQIQGRIVGEHSGTFSTFYEVQQTRAMFSSYLARKFGLVPYRIEPWKPGLPAGFFFFSSLFSVFLLFLFFSCFPACIGYGVSVVALLKSLFSLLSDVTWGDCSKSVIHVPANTIGLVLQGDGAPQSSRSGIVQIGLRFLDMGPRCMSPHSVFPLVIFSGEETYENIKHNTRVLSAEMSSMGADFSISSPTSPVPLRAMWHSSSDQSFLCKIYGIPSGRGCVKCSVDSNELSSAEAAKDAHERKAGTQHAPIFPSSVLPYDKMHVATDSLHEGMRSGDRQWDLWLDSSSASAASSSSVRAKISEVVHRHGFLNFEFVNEKNGHTFKYQNFSSDSKLKLFQVIDDEEIRSIFNECKMNEADIEQIIVINHLLMVSLEILNTWMPSADKIAHFQSITKKLNQEFLKKWGEADYCNYLHLLSFHAGEELTFFGNTLCFSCHALEECNHFDNQIFFNGTNHKFCNINDNDLNKGILEYRLRHSLNRFAKPVATFICPVDCFPAKTLSGLRRHAIAAKHDNIDELIRKAQQEAEAEES